MTKMMLLWQSVLVALQMIFGASATSNSVLAEFIDERWIGLMVVVVGALQAATVFYQRGGTVVSEDTIVVKRDASAP